MKKLIAAAILLSAAIPTQGFAGVKILGVSVPKDSVCPGAATSKCVQKSNSATGTYVGGDKRYINIGADSEPIYDEYLGRIYTRALNKGVGYCRNLSGSNDLFNFAKSKGINYIQTPQQNSVHFSLKAKRVVDAKAGIDAVAVANAAGIPPEATKDVAAAISASYGRVSNRELDIYGTYKFVEINPEVLAAMSTDDAPADLKACVTWLRDHKADLIVSLTGYKLDRASASSELAESFSTRLRAAVGGKVTDAQMLSIESGFASEISKKAKLTFSPTFALLSVGSYPPE